MLHSAVEFSTTMSEQTPLIGSSPGYGPARAGTAAAPASASAPPIGNPLRSATWPERAISGRSNTAATAEAAALAAVQGNWNGQHTALAYVYAARRRRRERTRRIKRLSQALLFLVLVYFVSLKLAILYERHCGPDVPKDQRGRYCF